MNLFRKEILFADLDRATSDPNFEFAGNVLNVSVVD